MSYYWSEESHSAIVRISSMRALLAAMDQVGSIQIIGTFAEVEQVRDAERALESATKHFESSTAMSLEDVKAMEKAIHTVMQANENLQNAQMNLKNIGLPNHLSFTSNGSTYNLNMVAGAYTLTWTERYQHTGDGRRTGVREGGTNERAFVKRLNTAYSNAINSAKSEEKMWAKRTSGLDDSMKKELELAVRVRTRWEAVEAAQRLKAQKQETTEHVVGKIEAMGWRSEVTHIDEEVIILGETFVETGGSSSSQYSSKW